MSSQLVSNFCPVPQIVNHIYLAIQIVKDKVKAVPLHGLKAWGEGVEV